MSVSDIIGALRSEETWMLCIRGCYATLNVSHSTHRCKPSLQSVGLRLKLQGHSAWSRPFTLSSPTTPLPPVNVGTQRASHWKFQETPCETWESQAVFLYSVSRSDATRMSGVWHNIIKSRGHSMIMLQCANLQYFKIIEKLLYWDWITAGLYQSSFNIL